MNAAVLLPVVASGGCTNLEDGHVLLWLGSSREVQVNKRQRRALKPTERPKPPKVEVGPQKFQRREIKTGLSDGLQIEIVSGLTQSDKVKSQPTAARKG